MRHRRADGADSLSPHTSYLECQGLADDVPLEQHAANEHKAPKLEATTSEKIGAFYPAEAYEDNAKVGCDQFGTTALLHSVQCTLGTRRRRQLPEWICLTAAVFSCVLLGHQSDERLRCT
jgi:hypothetical protein